LVESTGFEPATPFRAATPRLIQHDAPRAVFLTDPIFGGSYGIEHLYPGNAPDYIKNLLTTPPNPDSIIIALGSGLAPCY
jgi:hypothetical protein